ncbi:ABC transporter ATP-binding protein [Rhodocyclus tenuis]|uniref:Iron complex transport system ATP-binding protein n=1 Tax=Rhodocyclus tenuis TaxID=1066 RepID=A0A840GDG3_RHOTE|nr:ABC transporter ATP-binding protein [Rhodocyclus tenuis]MBB4248678.1 iron complex transport system ATP-binding protein [Rhodocyclus tenuis]
MLQARQLHFHYGRKIILAGVDLDLAPGELVCLLGSNGAGKSTLLRLLLGLIKPSVGEVLLAGRPIGAFTRRAVATQIAYVPQGHAAPFPYTVREVVLLGRLPSGSLFRAPGAEDHAHVTEVLARMGISRLADRPYTEVSGGERQLALIARALAQGARLLIMDEPGNGLDFGHQLRLLDCLLELSEAGFGILMTTHNPAHVVMGSNRVVVLENGAITADGAAAQVLTPAAVAALYRIDPERLTQDPLSGTISVRAKPRMNDAHAH